jgi:hypothetical protein
MHLLEPVNLLSTYLSIVQMFVSVAKISHLHVRTFSTIPVRLVCCAYQNSAQFDHTESSLSSVNSTCQSHLSHEYYVVRRPKRQILNVTCCPIFFSCARISSHCQLCTSDSHQFLSNPWVQPQLPSKSLVVFYFFCQSISCFF